MRVPAVNCGSSTLKFQLLDVHEATWQCSSDAPLAHGIVDKIGGSSSLEFATDAGRPLSRENTEVSDHRLAMGQVLEWLNDQGLLERHGVAAVGHRVIHGGDRFVEPTPVDDRVMGELEGASSLAPLHNRPALSAIEGAREALGQAVPMVAVFDTAFHRTIPARASGYAIPRELAERH
jgi:acetate kinase